LCSQRLLGRNLITLFSTVNTSPCAYARRDASHAGNTRRNAALVERKQRVTRIDTQCRTRCETAVFKLFAACTPTRILPPARNPSARVAACRDTKAGVRTRLPGSHQRMCISRRTRPTAPKVREPEDANA